MELHYAPGTCSLAAHIALHEAGLAFDAVEVDLHSGRLRDGGDYAATNSKGYVPMLSFDDGTRLTETVAILDWIAQRSPALAPADGWSRTRVLEMLAFLCVEVQKPLVFAFTLDDEGARGDMAARAATRLHGIAGELQGDTLFAGGFGVADAHLYVMLRWAAMAGIALPQALADYRCRIEPRASVQRALREQGLA